MCWWILCYFMKTALLSSGLKKRTTVTTKVCCCLEPNGPCGPISVTASTYSLVLAEEAPEPVSGTIVTVSH